MQNFRRASSMTPDQYAEALWTKALGCKQVYTEYTLKRIFVKGLLDSIRISICPSPGLRESPTLQFLHIIPLYSRLSKERIHIGKPVPQIANKTLVETDVEARIGPTSVTQPIHQAQIRALDVCYSKLRLKQFVPCSWGNRARHPGPNRR